MNIKKRLKNDFNILLNSFIPKFDISFVFVLLVYICMPWMFGIYSLFTLPLTTEVIVCSVVFLTIFAFNVVMLIVACARDIVEAKKEEKELLEHF